MTQVSSTGSLGFALRSNERAYNNYPRAVTTENLEGFYGDVTDQLLLVGSNIEGTTVTRSVLRTVMTEDALGEIARIPGLSRYIEAAAPLPDDKQGGPKEYLLYFARNAVSRSMDEATRSEFRSRVDKARKISSRPSRSLLPPGYTFTNRVYDPHRLNELWGDTFGWDEQGCIDFAKRIEADATSAPEDHSVWFGGIQDKNGILVTGAMAERLDVPTSTGRVALIEHTEWATHPDYRGQGLGRHVVRSLTDVVRADLAGVRHLVFAECNLTSGANIVAAHSGFTVPRLETTHGPVDQIISANVRVDDGYEPRGAYRNFMFTIVE